MRTILTFVLRYCRVSTTSYEHFHDLTSINVLRRARSIRSRTTRHDSLSSLVKDIHASLVAGQTFKSDLKFHSMDPVTLNMMVSVIERTGSLTRPAKERLINTFELVDQTTITQLYEDFVNQHANHTQPHDASRQHADNVTSTQLESAGSRQHVYYVSSTTESAGEGIPQPDTAVIDTTGTHYKPPVAQSTNVGFSSWVYTSNEFLQSPSRCLSAGEVCEVGDAQCSDTALHPNQQNCESEVVKGKTSKQKKSDKPPSSATQSLKRPRSTVDCEHDADQKKKKIPKLKNTEQLTEESELDDTSDQWIDCSSSDLHSELDDLVPSPLCVAETKSPKASAAPVVTAKVDESQNRIIQKILHIAVELKTTAQQAEEHTRQHDAKIHALEAHLEQLGDDSAAGLNEALLLQLEKQETLVCELKKKVYELEKLLGEVAEREKRQLGEAAEREKRAELLCQLDWLDDCWFDSCCTCWQLLLLLLLVLCCCCCWLCWCWLFEQLDYP